MDLNIRQTQGASLKQKQKLATKIRVATVMKLPEHTFGSFIKEVEDDPAFRKLLAPDDKTNRIVAYRKFPGVACAFNFYELNEDANRDKTTIDIESLLQERGDVVKLIKGIGIENFEKYFLYNEDGLPPEKVSEICALALDDVHKINDVIDELSVHSEFYHPSAIPVESHVAYHKVAAIEEDGNGAYIIKFFSPRFTRGKYIIDYARFNALRKQKAFSPEELSRMNRLLKNLELINSRKSTLYQILLEVTKRQEVYLKSGNERDLVPFAQKELAKAIRIDESLASRAISGKSIETPGHEEKPLQFFFPSKKDIRKNNIREILEAGGDSLTDQQITNLLREKFHVVISRRTVNVCRKELEAAMGNAMKIPADDSNAGKEDHDESR